MKAYRDMKAMVKEASVTDNACVIVNRMSVDTSIQAILLRPQNSHVTGCQRKTNPCREAAESLAELHHKAW